MGQKLTKIPQKSRCFCTFSVFVLLKVHLAGSRGVHVPQCPLAGDANDPNKDWFPSDTTHVAEDPCVLFRRKRRNMQSARIEAVFIILALRALLWMESSPG